MQQPQRLTRLGLPANADFLTIDSKIWRWIHVCAENYTIGDNTSFHRPSQTRCMHIGEKFIFLFSLLNNFAPRRRGTTLFLKLFSIIFISEFLKFSYYSKAYTVEPRLCRRKGVRIIESMWNRVSIHLYIALLNYPNKAYTFDKIL